MVPWNGIEPPSSHEIITVEFPDTDYPSVSPSQKLIILIINGLLISC